MSLFDSEDNSKFRNRQWKKDTFMSNVYGIKIRMCGRTLWYSRWLLADRRTCSLLPNGTDKICGFPIRNQNSEFFDENYRIRNPKYIVATDDLVLNNTMYYKYNIETRSRNQCCHRKAISITHSEFVSVALVIQQTMSMQGIIIICDLSKSTIFFHVT
jgi:hypothetical protein